MDIFAASEKFKQRLLAREQVASTDLVRAYGMAHGRISEQVARLSTEIDDLRSRGETISSSYLYERDRLTRLQQSIETEMRNFSAFASRRATDEQRAALALGLSDASTLTVAVGARVGALDRAAVEAVAGFASDGSRLRELFDDLGRGVSQRVRDELVASVAEGVGSRVIASRIRQASGIGLHRALVLARSTIIQSYRTATLETYRASAGMKAYRIQATLTARTCGYCWARHGKVYPLSQPFVSHLVCRCAAVPVTDKTPSVRSGAELFAEQESGFQLSVLGKEKFELYAAGKLELSDLIGERDDARWGKVGFERSLRELQA